MQATNFSTVTNNNPRTTPLCLFRAVSRAATGCHVESCWTPFNSFSPNDPSQRRPCARNER